MLWVAVFGLGIFAEALQILSPPEIAKDIPSPILNVLIGNQDPKFEVSGELVVVGFNECQRSNIPDVRGKIALIGIKSLHLSVSILEEERNAACLERAGATAVISTFARGIPALLPGIKVYWNDPHMTHRVKVPFLHTKQEQLLDVIDALPANTTVSVLAVPTRNPWKTVYDSTVFLIVMRVVIPLINFVALFVSVEATVSHFHRLIVEKPDFGNRRQRGTAWLMLIGSALEVVSSAIRAVYFSIGPVLSTTRLYYSQHMVLIFTTMGTDMLTTLISVSLFVRWGAFGENNTCFKAHSDLLFFLVAIANLVLLVLAGYVQGYLSTRVDVTFFITIASIVVLISLFVIGFLFLVLGFRFVRTLQDTLVFEAKSGDLYRTRALRKAMRWLVFSGACLLIQMAGTLAIAFQSAFYNAHGQFAIWAVVFFGVSLTGLSHAFAFRPVAESHRSVARKVQVIARAYMSPILGPPKHTNSAKDLIASPTSTLEQELT